MKKRQHIINTVQKLRKKQKLTQEELAQHLEVSRQTIISIEKGKYTPSILLALKIAAFFDTSVESIFTISSDS